MMQRKYKGEKNQNYLRTFKNTDNFSQLKKSHDLKKKDREIEHLTF